MGQIKLKANINECVVEGWQSNTGEVNARVMHVEMCEDLRSCDKQFVTFELADGTVYESLVVDGKAKIPIFEKPQFIKIGMYAENISGDECEKRYSAHPANQYVTVGSFKDKADEQPKPTPGDYAELLKEIEDIKNTGGGSSGDGFEILGEVSPTEEHTNEQVYGAKALDETFWALEEIINEVGKPITTEKIVNAAITIDKVEEDFFDKGLLFTEKQGDISFLSYKKEGEKPITLVAYLKDKAEEITQDNGDGIPTVQAVCDYVEEQLKNVGGSSSKVFEQIATVTVTADTDGKLPTKISITADDNGNPFELTDIYCEVLMGLTDGTAGRFYIQADKISLFGNAPLSFTNAALRKWFFRYDSFGEGLGGLVSAPNGSISAGINFPTANINTLFGQPIPVGMTLNIKSLNFVGQVGDTKTFMEGTTITLWGVRK